jgi:sugar phosphate isomerase/epimerase
MNRIGIYYAYWTHDWDADFHPFVDKVADLGFDILEVNAGTIAHMPSAERKRLKAHADDRNIGLTYCIGLPSKYDLASGDAATRQRGVAFLQTMAEAIGEMGGGKLGGIIYSCWPASLPAGETDRRPYFDRSVVSMKEAVKAAEAHAVTFNMEVVNRFEHYLLNTCAEAIEYVDSVGSPNAKIMLDTFHLHRGGFRRRGDSAGRGKARALPRRREQSHATRVWPHPLDRSERRVAQDQLPGGRDHGTVLDAWRRGRARHQGVPRPRRPLGSGRRGAQSPDVHARGVEIGKLKK